MRGGQVAAGTVAATTCETARELGIPGLAGLLARVPRWLPRSRLVAVLAPSWR